MLPADRAHLAYRTRINPLVLPWWPQACAKWQAQAAGHFDMGAVLLPSPRGPAILAALAQVAPLLPTTPGSLLPPLLPGAADPPSAVPVWHPMPHGSASAGLSPPGAALLRRLGGPCGGG